MRQSISVIFVLPLFLLSQNASAKKIRLSFTPSLKGKSISLPNSNGKVLDYTGSAELAREDGKLVAILDPSITIPPQPGSETPVIITRIIISDRLADKIETLASFTQDRVVLGDSEIRVPDLEARKAMLERFKEEKTIRGTEYVSKENGQSFKAGMFQALLETITKPEKVKRAYKLPALALSDLDFAEAQDGKAHFDGKVGGRSFAVLTADGGISFRGASESPAMDLDAYFTRPSFALSDPRIQEVIQSARNYYLKESKWIESAGSRMSRSIGGSGGFLNMPTPGPDCNSDLPDLQ